MVDIGYFVVYEGSMNTLQAWRKRQNISQVAAGKRFMVTGVSVGRYEAGRVPAESVMLRIVAATAGEVRPNDFFMIA